MKIPAVIFSTLLIGSIVCAWIGAHDPLHNAEARPHAVDTVVLWRDGYGIYFRETVSNRRLDVHWETLCTTYTFYSNGHCTETTQEVK
jgi:hypothetical protein